MIYSLKKNVHTTVSENALAYVLRGDSKLTNWIIVMGFIMSVYGLYQGYNYAGICYMILYLLLEIFHPPLFEEDASAVPASAYSEG
ncbi:hypothetical protein [Chitinophaga niabensis]|uniref:Uncharacterized protein n=1 Tax=Chitinophaga niabensis TaxID=536979 RepID=A0A1N6KE44_9BACT|nr:hypothetical protein [Chitinophaga niabensis]SIO54850.1 hypothetical protein SAMN04488055_5679 [Chitinophaga niabensis]